VLSMGPLRKTKKYGLAVAMMLPLPLAMTAVAAQKAKTGKPDIGKQSPTPAAVRTFLASHCYDCHNGKNAEAKLDLTSLKFDLNDSKTFATWVKIHDRVKAGEMPPPAMEKLKETVKKPFLNSLATPLIASDTARERRDGRSTWRRMNRYEYENTLRDLLGAPWLQIKDMLPEDGQAYRFNKVGDALDVSHVLMSRYLAVADYALREAIAKQATPPKTTIQRFYAREQRSYIGPSKFSEFNGSPERATFLLLGNKADLPTYDGTGPATVGDKDPVKREQEAVGVVASAYEPLEPKFDRFRAPVSGRYKLRIRAHSFWAGPENAQRWWRPSRTDISPGRTQEPIRLYAETPPRQLRQLGSFNVGPESGVAEQEVYLLKGETIRPDAVRFFRSRPPAFRNPLAQADGQPGVAFQWLEVEGPIYDSWPGVGQRLLFGDLPIKTDPKGKIEVASNNPDADAQRLLRGFLQRAYRRPAQADDLATFVKLYHTAQAAGMDFTDSMITAYSAVLCSPAFVTLQEKPGPLDDYALASRLAYFLWNSEPDTQLRSLASKGELHKPAVLRAQTDRMLADPRTQRFVNAFLDYWLDLRKVNDNSPDELLYPDYYLDDFLTESSQEETRRFFAELIRNNLPARNLVDSNFVMVNERLAELYGISGVKGVAIRRVSLPKDSPRGGLLTQSSILKVTSNGTTTSPVVRGAWITERILGQPVPPPPPNIPAVEPDTRGAVTIRQQLDKHRSDATCKSCHAKIDPPGFALENFDVCGGWRDRYRALGDGEKVPGRGKNGQAFAFHAAQPVDASGTLPDGRPFQNIKDFKRLLAKDERQVARNLVRQFITYGTGAPVSFGDRLKVEAILDQAKPSDYGVRSLLQSVVESELFRNK
jgi:hypothetical protein